MLGFGGGPVNAGEGAFWVPTHPASATAMATNKAGDRADKRAIRFSPKTIDSLLRAAPECKPQCAGFRRILGIIAPNR